VLRNTWCPAVLTENLFQDNKEDVDFLLSDEGRQAIVDLHVRTIDEIAR
jgi:N-acetylmuramoyl-L-alanine amidase